MFLKSAKSHAERLIEINFKTMLREMPQGKDYFITVKGRLEKRDGTAAWRRGGGVEGGESERRPTKGGEKEEY